MHGYGCWFSMSNGGGYFSSYEAGVPGVLVADASFEKEVAFDCFIFFVLFFFVNTTAGLPPKFPRADMSSLVLHVVQMAPSGGVQKTV